MRIFRNTLIPCLTLLLISSMLSWLYPAAVGSQNFEDQNFEDMNNPNSEETNSAEPSSGIQPGNADPAVASWFSTYDQMAKLVKPRQADQQGLERVLNVMSTTPTPDAATAKTSISRLQQRYQQAFNNNLPQLPETAMLSNLLTEYILRSNDFYRDLIDALDGTVNSDTASKFRQLRERKRSLDTSYAEIQRTESELRLKYNIPPAAQQSDQ